MAEPSPSCRKSKGGNRTVGPQSYSVSHAAPNTIATHRHTYKRTRGLHSREEHYDPSQNADGYNSHDTARYYSADHAARDGYGNALPRIPVTAQVLLEHNLQQANVAHQQRQARIFEAIVAPPDGHIQNLYRGGIETLERKPLYGDIISHTQGQQKRTASMYNEADRHTPNYQSAILAPYVYDADYLSCDTESAGVGELTTWGYALAGIGEHLVDHRYQECINRDELTID